MEKAVNMYFVRKVLSPRLRHDGKQCAHNRLRDADRGKQASVLHGTIKFAITHFNMLQLGLYVIYQKHSTLHFEWLVFNFSFF